MHGNLIRFSVSSSRAWVLAWRALSSSELGRTAKPPRDLRSSPAKSARAGEKKPALRQVRALDRCDEVRTPPTESDRDYEELQDEMDRLEQSIEESEWTRQTTSISLFDENKLFKEIDKQRQKMAGLRRYVTFLESMSGSYVLFSTVPTITCRTSCV